MGSVKLSIAKENIKFSAAHFLIFNAHEAERLHGHNYQVSAEIEFFQDSPRGQYKIDFSVVKSILKSLVSRWDEYVLFPELNSEMKYSKDAESLFVKFRNRSYQFPIDEVILLTLENTSVEGFSYLLANDLKKEMINQNLMKDVLSLAVTVEESPGQAATTILKLP